MNKKALLLVLAAATFCFALLFTFPPWAKRPIALAFAGFTNTDRGYEALFWFTNRANPDFFWRTTLSRLTPTGWVEQPQVSESRYTPRAASGKPLPGYSDIDLIGISVASTNQDLLALVEASEPVGLRRRLQIWWAEFRESRRTRTKVKYSHVQSIFATGQVVIAAQARP